MLPAEQNVEGPDEGLDEPPAALRSGAMPGSVESPGVVSVPGRVVSGLVTGALPSALAGGKPSPGEPSEGFVAMPLGVLNGALGGSGAGELNPGVVAVEPRPEPPLFGVGVVLRIWACARLAAASIAAARKTVFPLSMEASMPQVLQAPCRRKLACQGPDPAPRHRDGRTHLRRAPRHGSFAAPAAPAHGASPVTALAPVPGEETQPAAPGEERCEDHLHYYDERVCHFASPCPLRGKQPAPQRADWEVNKP